MPNPRGDIFFPLLSNNVYRWSVSCAYSSFALRVLRKQETCYLCGAAPSKPLVHVYRTGKIAP